MKKTIKKIIGLYLVVFVILGVLSYIYRLEILATLIWILL